MHYSDIKKRVHTILDNPEKSDKRTQQVHVIIAVAILVNAFAIILYSVKEISSLYSGILNLVINSCLLLFAVEYILRIWSCTDTKNPLGMITDRVKYAMSFYLIIDLLSIIPIFIPFILPNQITLIRLLRLVSIFKLGRFTKYSKSLEQLKRVFKRKSEIFVIMLFFLVFILLFSSVIMYVVEYSAQPDKFSSIPASLWWAVMTVTTVGYGDIIPITPLGKIIASIVTLTGDSAEASVTADDGQGNSVEVNAKAVTGTINAEQSAMADPGSGTNGDQVTNINAGVGIATTVASNEEGNTANAATWVIDGTLATDQSASTNGGAGATVAGQTSTVEGAQGYANVVAADNTGAVAEGRASVMDGTIDTNQQAIVYTDGVDVNQQTTAEGAGATVTSTSTATNGDTATVSAEVTNGQIAVGNQVAGNWGAEDAYAGNYDALVIGESGSASVTATAADGATARATSEMELGEIIATQNAIASGSASAGQNAVASGIVADTYSTANDGLGNSAFVLSSVNNGVINADQSITADPVTGIAGNQETFVVAQDGIGLVVAEANSGVSSNSARVQASAIEGNISASQNVGNNVNEPNDTFVDQTAILDAYNGSGETSSITESDGRLVSIQNGVSGSHMDSTYQAYSSDAVNTLEFQESNDHTTSGGTSNFALEIRNSINGDKFDTSGFSEVNGWGNVSNDDLLLWISFKA